MNRLRVCILFFAFAVIAARAEQTNTPAPASATNNAAPSAVTSNALPDTITIGGVTYSNVTWRSVTPATVTIFHSTGIAAIPLGDLPPELQKQFGYDPQKATAWQATQQKSAAARADAERRQALLRKYAAQGITFNVGGIGILNRDVEPSWLIDQIIDAKTMLIHQPFYSGIFGQGPIAGFSADVCLQGVPTSSYVDNQNLDFRIQTGMVFKVTGNRYEGQTIFVLEPYDGK
jgi:hypothetical protein